MKSKIIGLLLAATLILSGCGGSQSADNNSQSAVTESVTAGEDTTEKEVPDEASLSIPDSYYISPKNTGKLRVENGTLCAEDGTPVQLKGVSTSAITRVADFINPELFAEMRTDWGVNVVRLCMYIQSMDGYTKSDTYKTMNTNLVRQGVELCKEADMYALIDWHVLDEKTPMKYVEESKAFFDMMSAEYKDENHVIYEICNEPNETEWPEIKEYANQVHPGDSCK